MHDTDKVVFVVDDEPVIAKTLCIVLNKAGFRAIPSIVLRRRLPHRPKCPRISSFSDVMMPRMTGVDLAIHFREAQPDCKVLLFSGQAATADLLEKARAQGHDFDLLSKPINPADLLVKLRI